MGKTIKGFYVLQGETFDELPDAIGMKSVGGRVVFGNFVVEHRTNPPIDAYPWVVLERGLIGTANTAETYTEIETYREYREALRAARRLAVKRHITAHQPQTEIPAE